MAAFIQWRGKNRDFATLVWDVPGEPCRQRLTLGRVSPRVATVHLRDLQSRLGHGEDRPVGALGLGDALDDFLESRRRDCDPVTVRGYAKHLGHVRRLLNPEARISDFTPKTIAAYMARRVDGYRSGGRDYLGVHKRTVNAERRTLSVFWHWLEQRGDAKGNPARLCPPYKKVGRPKPTACPEDVLSAMVIALRASAREKTDPKDAFPRELYADVLTVLWATGRRTGELLRLPPADLDLAAAKYLIRNAPNKGGERWFAIPPAVLPIFAKHAARRDERGRALPFVFATRDGRSAYWPLYELRKHWLKQHPEHRPAAHHALRHALADRARKAGVDALVRPELFGHSGLEMTSHYAHEDLQDQREAFALIEAAKAAKATREAPTAPPSSTALESPGAE